MSTRLFVGCLTPLFINIVLGLNAIDGYHLANIYHIAMVTSHGVGVLHIDCKHH